MHIDTLELTNFRAFEKESVTFSMPFTLLLGDNGTGKTALLEALRIAIGVYLSALDGLRPPGIIETDIHERLLPDNLGGVAEPPERVQYAPVVLKATGQLEDGKTVQWERHRNKVSSSSTTGNIELVRQHVAALAEERTQRGQVNLPLLAYYPAHRGSRGKTPDPISRVQKPERWQRAYDTALDPSVDRAAPFRWVANTTYAELQENTESQLLRATLKAIADCLEGVTHVFYSVQLDELVTEDEQGRRRRALTLSAGYWTMLLMLLDMAHRCATLNPHLGANVLRETPGIVLIDELDIHLHPRWQQRIVSDLCRAFPRVQFIATTHSPLISASLPSEALRHLEVADDGTCHVRHYAERTQGLSPDQMLSTPYFDLDSDRPLQAQEHLDKLSDRILDGDTDAALEYLRVLNEGTELSVAHEPSRRP